MNEAALIRILRHLDGVQGIGDDCAVLPWTGTRDLLVTTDQFVEGIHFQTQTHSPANCGWKALARNLSDIAAMGGKPRYCFVSLSLSQHATTAWFRRFYQGLLRLARRHNVTVAGGDLTTAPNIYCDIMLLGFVPKGRALRRANARPGDLLYVTGTLGGASLGLRTLKGTAGRKHFRPEPRLEVGQALLGRASAAMDVSDGISLDLHRLCLESSVAADLDRVPIFPGANLEDALHGGDDYELLFTAPVKKRIPASIQGSPVTLIGRIVSGKPGTVRFQGKPLPTKGWDSFR